MFRVLLDTEQYQYLQGVGPNMLTNLTDVGLVVHLWTVTKIPPLPIVPSKVIYTPFLLGHSNTWALI